MRRPWWVIVFAVASMATPRPRWWLEAEVPKNDTFEARLVEIEASHPPEISLQDATGTSNLRPPPGSTWPGKATFFIPKGQRIYGVKIWNWCSGSGCCSCDEPDGAYIRITKLEDTAAWVYEHKGTPHHMELVPGKFHRTRITVTADHPVHVVANHELMSGVQTYDGGFLVHWKDVPEPRSFDWTPHLTMQGPCGSYGCMAPENPKFTIDVKNEE